ncbi:MAG: hypothetical protein R3B90_09375 [Planctomycetaceae bacterium]
MFPFRDNVASERLPIINGLMIAICSFVFLAQMQSGDEFGPGLTIEYGMIPFRISHPGEEFEVPTGYRQIEGPRGQLMSS